MDPLVTRPVIGLSAFTATGVAAEWTRSAQLLQIAAQLRPPGATLSGATPSGATPSGAAPPPPVAARARAEPHDIGTPRVRPLESISGRVMSAPSNLAPEELWTELDATGAPDTAVALLLTQLDSPSQIARVAAAASLVAAGTQRERAESVLRGIRRFDSTTARALTALTLGDVGRRRASSLPPARQTAVSIAIPGSFGRWRSTQLSPGGPLFRLLKADIAPDLYTDAASAYRWTGGYSQRARLDAAADLRRWIEQSGVTSTDGIYSHSHGGNVALDAVSLGIDLRFLLLIDTPALRRSTAEWTRINARVGRAVSLRSRLDLVILLDQLLNGGPGAHGSDGLTFDAAFDVRLLSPPVWFSHTALLRPSVWAKFGLVEQIRYEYGLAGASSAKTVPMPST